MPRLRLFTLFLLVLALNVCLAVTVTEARAETPARAPAQNSTPSLYKRLGGYDAIAAVTDDFVPRLVADPLLGRFFVGHGMDTKLRIRQHIVELVCAAAGGPCVYIGRDMKTTHKGLGITEADWTAASNLFVATLDKLGVGQKEKDELLAIVGGLKKDIVEVPAAGK